MVKPTINVYENDTYGGTKPKTRRCLCFSLIDAPRRQASLDYIGGIAYDDDDKLCLLSGNRIRLRSYDDGPGILHMVR
jgi:hypothetical protein